MDIAIIGMAVRAPGARDVNELWDNLEAGRESISRFSLDELRQAGIEPALLDDPGYVPAASTFDGADQFDAQFFGYTPREATIIDPQHRVLLECAWEALEHAGYDPYRSDRAIGVYAGASMNTYLLYSGMLSQMTRDWVLTLSASDKDFLATRINYKLDLKGPGLTIQTACSTSLVAVHVACQSLRLGECDMALAGGVCVKVPQKAGYVYRAGGLFSADGHVRAFDAKATGTVFGSGAGLVVLKPLDDARRDNDTIYAIIRGSAINNDGGAKASYTAPSVRRQADVIVEALANAGVEAETVSYIETHGTGTPLGDPIEVAALTAAFRTSTSNNGFCAIGSLKTNVGHLEAAAGVAGLIKATLALHHRRIPASLHYEAPNPEIDFASSPFYVAATSMAWPGGATPRRAGVSALGVGGTNVHVVLEEGSRSPATKRVRSHDLLVLSARTETALAEIRTRLSAWMEGADEVDLADAAYTLQVGRKRFDVRDFVVCESRADAIRQLAGPGAPHKARRNSSRRIAFVCARQPRNWSAEAALFDTEPRFRQAIEAACTALARHLGFDASASLWTDGAMRARAAERIGQPRLDAVTTVIAQVALGALWESCGIRADVVVGDGIGELAAACLAGRLALDDALAIIVDGVAPPAPSSTSSQVRVFSTVTCTWIADERVDRSAWLARLDQPPRYAEMANALADEPLSFLELGAASDCTRQLGRAAPCLSSLPDDDAAPSAHLMTALGRLWTEGAEIDWEGVQAGRAARRIALPTYPFERKRFWYEPG